MATGIRLTVLEVAERLKTAGLELRSGYVNQKTKVTVWCPDHQCLSDVFEFNIFKGQRAPCCGNASRSMTHTGRPKSAETREKLSRYCGEHHHGFGKQRSEETRRRVSQSLLSASRETVEYAAHKAETGKTAGKTGFFYIASVPGGLLKFGSVVRLTPKRRAELLRREHGSVEMRLVVPVDDAGAYEAAMMRRHRERWVHGEYFREN